jgi:polysaccharide pyruvyl transferase WcaK-like protein
VSPSGFGNLGDAAIIESLLAGIRRRRPGAEIIGFTLNPADTCVRHGVEAYTCGAFALPHYPIRRAPRAPAAGEIHHPGEDPAPRLRRLRRIIGNLPGARQGRRAVTMATSELRHRHEVATRLAGCDHVVVAGGGQLDEFWGGPFGHPYTLYRFSSAARRAGARFDILSVGQRSAGSSCGARSAPRATARSATRARVSWQTLPALPATI